MVCNRYLENLRFKQGPRPETNCHKLTHCYVMSVTINQVKVLLQKGKASITLDAFSFLLVFIGYKKNGLIYKCASFAYVFMVTGVTFCDFYV